MILLQLLGSMHPLERFPTLSSSSTEPPAPYPQASAQKEGPSPCGPHGGKVCHSLGNDKAELPNALLVLDLVTRTPRVQ